MRDVVRDAAIIVMAQKYKELIIPIETFLEMYEDKESLLPEYVMDLLFDMEMVKKEWQKIPVWSPKWSAVDDREQVWVWA